jgi:CubicO group peptidase (beta-lactamase class C family)
MKKRLLQGGLVCVFIIGFAAFVSAQGLPRATPESVGMSSERLDRINQYMKAEIERGEIVGAVTVVARRGKIVHLGLHGLADRENNKPMRADTPSSVSRPTARSYPLLEP